MHWHEHHRPMPEDARFDNFFVRQAAEIIHNVWINEHPNNNPRNVKKLRYHFLNQRMYLVASLVDDTAHDEKPRIYLH